MNIERCGAQRFSGWTTIAKGDLLACDPISINISWDSESDSLAFHIKEVKDLSVENAYYDYKVLIPKDELSLVVSALLSLASKQTEGNIIDSLSSSTETLLRLAALSAGFVQPSNSVEPSIDNTPSE